MEIWTPVLRFTRMISGLKTLGVLEMLRRVPSVMGEAFVYCGPPELTAENIEALFIIKSWSQEGSNRRAAEQKTISFWRDFLIDGNSIDWYCVQCLKFWYKFVNNELPCFFKSIFTYNRGLYETKTHSHRMLHLCPTTTAGARNVDMSFQHTLWENYAPTILGSFCSYQILYA